MRYIKLIGLAMIAVVALMAAWGGVASATEYVYKVEGAKLEANEKKEIRAKLKPGTEFTIKGKGVLNAEWVAKCTGFQLLPGEKPVIAGGLPGTSEKEVFVFEGCTATVGGAKCSSLEGASTETNDELVNVQLPAAQKGKLANWFAPDNEAKIFIVFKFNKCGIFGTQKAEITGTTAAFIAPEAVEGQSLTWVWTEGAGEITEIERHNGEKFKPELIAGEKKEKVRFNGEILVELVTKQNWGAF